MPIVTGGKVIEPGSNATNNPGLKQRIYWTEALPTDSNIGVTAANGMIAVNAVNGNVYERQAGVWTRVDTL